MTGLLGRTLAGAAAGAAATTALNATTYLDMALRGRPTSSTPQETVERMAQAYGITVPGDDQTRQNRLDGLGPLSGIATGVAVGVGYGLLDALHLRPRSLPVGAALAGGGAMALANTGMVRYGVTDPGSWTVAEWVSDLVPHVAYGVVLAATYSAARPHRH